MSDCKDDWNPWEQEPEQQPEMGSQQFQIPSLSELPEPIRKHWREICGQTQRMILEQFEKIKSEPGEKEPWVLLCQAIMEFIAFQQLQLNAIQQGMILHNNALETLRKKVEGKEDEPVW